MRSEDLKSLVVKAAEKWHGGCRRMWVQGPGVSETAASLTVQSWLHSVHL